ncbi:hypothetical protein EYC80_005372 [Monilinia laxa]|uniref:2EXR domain-containing protein n=1 Tax=Monilinia laxa TaxID=61186 RepID=A0A5N6KJS2_MONLA|nr:hypothetical protein EYC80_005372 [Monilinia laxa]
MPFPKLALEIRFKTWKFAAFGEARILELVLHSDFILPAPRTPEAIAEDPVGQNDLTSFNHHIYQAFKLGQRVPGVMQTDSESHCEGMLVFEKRYINSHPRAYSYIENDKKRPWIWYNPSKDIIFFGKDTCIRTAVDIFRYNPNKKYAKVAFRCANMELHGLDEDIALDNMVPGAPGVKEMSFVVKAECMKFEAVAMPSNLTFRPSIDNRLTAS